MIPVEVQPIYDYAILVKEHGNEGERKRQIQEFAVMRELSSTFPGSTWQPMESVVLIQHLVDRADRLAARRLDMAKNLHYKDHQGKVGRELKEERATVRAQFAAQIMLGLPLGKPDTYQEARKLGNIGRQNEAFLPLYNTFHHHLIVNPRTPDGIACWLITDEGGNCYRLQGWIKSEEAKQEMFLRTRQREGGVSKAYWIPVSALRPVTEWWDGKRE